MPSTSVQAGHHVCALLGCVLVASMCSLFVCVLCLVTAHTSQVFTDFNDWAFGMTSVCVPWDLLLLTEGVKGKLTFAFHPDGQSVVYFFCHC